MAPFATIISEVRPREETGDVSIPQMMEKGEAIEFHAQVDDEWLFFNVPNGDIDVEKGYLIGLILQACSLAQRNTQHIHPLWLSSQFLGPSGVGPCTITVKCIKRGKTSSNLVTELSQNGRINLQAQLVYGMLPIAKHPLGPFPAAPNYMTPPHPHPLSRTCPLVTHPSKCTTVPFPAPFTFAKHVAYAFDPYYLDYMERMTHGESRSTMKENEERKGPDGIDMGKGGFVHAAWLDLLSPEDHVITQILPLFADICPDLVPVSVAKEAGRHGPLWFPTLGLSADFKHLPPVMPSVTQNSDQFSTQSVTSLTPSSLSLNEHGIQTKTVGVYIRGYFLIEGRFDMTVEVWTAPSMIGKGVEEYGWRDRMYCMTSMTQSAMTISAAVNKAKGKRLDGTHGSGMSKL